MIKSSYISRNRKPMFFDARTWWGMSQSAFSISLGTARTRHGMFQCSWNFCKISNIKLNINLKIWWHLLCSMFKEICFLSLSLTWKTRNIPSWVNSTCIKQTTNNDGKFRPKASTTSQKGPGSQLFFFSFSGPEALYHSGPAKSGIRYDEAANPWEFSAENGQGTALHSSASSWMENFLRRFGHVWKWDPCFWHVLLQRKNHLQ